MSGLRFIFKFSLDPAAGGQHAMPADARFLDLQVQDGVPVMWWSVPHHHEPQAEWPLRTFTIAVTGGPGHSEGLHYVGTFQLGGFVGHVMSHEEIPRA